MGVPERTSSDFGSAPFQRAGTQADGGAMEASSGMAERSARQEAVRSIILILYRANVGGKRPPAAIEISDLGTWAVALPVGLRRAGPDRGH